MLVIAAMMLLATLALSVNGTIAATSSISLEMEANLDALSYGQSLMDEILDKNFDQNVVTTRKFNYSDMSAYLGPDGSEVFTLPDTSSIGIFLSKDKYNDVDDYNGYIRQAKNSRLDVFKLTVSVHYTIDNGPFTESASKCFYKDVIIDVRNPYMSIDDSPGDTLRQIELRGLAVYRKYF